MTENSPDVNPDFESYDKLVKEEKKEVSKSVSVVSKLHVNDIREVVFMIRQKTKGEMNFKKISNACGWSDSRVSQILRNWDNPKLVSENKKSIIYQKLKDCLDSVSGITEKEGESGTKARQN